MNLRHRTLRDELAFLLDSTVDLAPESYDRRRFADTLLMRLEACFLARESRAVLRPALRPALRRLTSTVTSSKVDSSSKEA